MMYTFQESKVLELLHDIYLTNHRKEQPPLNSAQCFH